VDVVGAGPRARPPFDDVLGFVPARKWAGTVACPYVFRIIPEPGRCSDEALTFVPTYHALGAG